MGLDETFTPLSNATAGAAGRDRRRSARAAHGDAGAARPGAVHRRHDRTVPPLPPGVREPRQGVGAARPRDRRGDPRRCARRPARQPARRDSVRPRAIRRGLAHGPRARAADPDGDAARAHARVHEPAQTTCNYLALFFRNLESALSESDVIGSFLRIGILALPQLPDSEAGPSSAAADGPPAPAGAPQIKTLEDDSFLHSNPYPNTDCPWPDSGVRGRQRALHQGPAGDRQRPRQPGAGHREDEAERLRWTGAASHRSVEPDRDRAAGDRHLLRVHQGDPVRAALHGQRGRPELEPAGPGLAGADRRRQRRQGHRPSAATATPISGWSRCRSRAPNDARGRDDPDPPAAVPRGQLLRRPLGGDSGRPRLHSGGTIPVGHTSDPVQIDQVLDAFPRT